MAHLIAYLLACLSSWLNVFARQPAWSPAWLVRRCSWRQTLLMQRHRRERQTATPTAAGRWWLQNVHTLSGWGDLNSRPLVPQTSALTKLRHSPKLRLGQSTNGAMIRQPRYNTKVNMSNLKCHGAFSPLNRCSSRRDGASLVARMGISMARSHTGQRPCADTADGAK